MTTDNHVLTRRVSAARATAPSRWPGSGLRTLKCRLPPQPRTLGKSELLEELHRKALELVRAHDEQRTVRGESRKHGFDIREGERTVREVRFIMNEKAFEQLVHLSRGELLVLERKPPFDQGARTTPNEFARFTVGNRIETGLFEDRFSVSTRSGAVSTSVPSRSKQWLDGPSCAVRLQSN